MQRRGQFLAIPDELPSLPAFVPAQGGTGDCGDPAGQRRFVATVEGQAGASQQDIAECASALPFDSEQDLALRRFAPRAKRTSQFRSGLQVAHQFAGSWAVETRDARWHVTRRRRCGRRFRPAMSDSQLSRDDAQRFCRERGRGSQLPPGHGQQASDAVGALVVNDRVAPRYRVEVRPVRGDERAGSAVRVEHALGFQRGRGKQVVGFVDQVSHLLPGRRHRVRVACERALGGADQVQSPPRDDEERAAIRARLAVHRVLGRAGKPAHHDVRTVDQSQQRVARRVRQQGQHSVDPRPRRVHHETAAQYPTPVRTFDVNARDRRPPDHESGRPRVIADFRACLRGLQGCLQRQSLRERGLAIEVLESALQALRIQARLQRERLGRAQPPRGGRASPGTEQAVQRQARRDIPSRPGVRSVVRQQEGSRLDQAVEISQQCLAIPQGLANQAELEALEVAEAAVDQTRRATRYARTEVELVDQGRAQAGARGRAGQHAAVDAAAHDDHVEWQRAVQLRL